MNEIKYTPGPWRSRLSTNAAKALNVEAGTLGHNIALVNRHGNKNLQEAAANARLIAAAPDMLAALNKCDSAFVAWQVGQIPGRPEDILALITEVRAAIAKAGGQ